MSTSGSRRPEPRFVDPSRITTARLRRGLTKSALARELQVTPRTVAKYEDVGAPVDRAGDLAAALTFPETYFLRGPAPRLDLQDVSFRAGTRVSVRTRQAAIASGRHGVEVAEWVARRFRLPATDIPRIEDTTPEEAARLLRELWGLGVRPLPNLVQLCESRGCRVLGLPALAAPVDAFSAWHEGEPHIFLARRRSPEGVRFDVAHELGHLVMHSAGISFEMSAEQERAANRFASEFLLPTDGVTPHLPDAPSIELLLRVKKHFRVSALALARKAFTLGRLSEGAYRQTVSELARRGFRYDEPDGTGVHERSRVFDYVFAPERTGAYSPAAVAGELGLPVSDIRALTLSSTLGVVDDVDGDRDAPPREETVEEPAARRHLRLVGGVGRS